MIKYYKDKQAPLDYDPEWVVKLAVEQYPEEIDLIENLKNCTKVIGFCECGCGDPYFIEPGTANYQYKESICLERDDGIEIIIDIMKNGMIGSFEIGEWDKKH